MKAALYIRVSTEEQVDGFSLAAQLNLLQKYCENNSLGIFDVYADEGVSGQKENRPEFQRMLRDAERKAFNIILVHKYDRFARRVELSQRVKNQLKKNGINVVSITEPLEDSPMGFFVGGLHDLLAEYYVRNLAIESKKGHVERARQGLHNGSVPFGYKIDQNTGMMVINEEQATIVKQIFHMYNHQGYGSTKIAKILNENKVRTAVNGEWAHYTVSRILKNPKYIGKILYDGEIYAGKHEPIITEDEFRLVHKNMKDRTWERRYRGVNYERFVLLGIAKCGECKRAYGISVVRKSTRNRVNSLHYYFCNGGAHQSGCTNNKHHQAVKLEKLVLDNIKKATEIIPDGVTIINKEPVFNLYDNKKKKIEKELKRAKEAYLAGVFSIQEYKELKEKYVAELKEIGKQLKKDTDENLKRKLQGKIVDAWGRIEAAETAPEKRTILQEFIDRIYIYKDRIEIIFVC